LRELAEAFEVVARHDKEEVDRQWLFTRIVAYHAVVENLKNKEFEDFLTEPKLPHDSEKVRSRTLTSEELEREYGIKNPALHR
jgi:hypothetical protein